jgi:group I intron endonuclease
LIVYKAVNKINGKIYVGQTVKALRTRIGEHFNRPRTPFDYALRKYGRMNFEITILDICGTREQMNEREIYWIKAFNCKSPNGYNLNDGGNGSNPSPGTIEKLKLINKGRVRSEEERWKNREAHLGRPQSEETRRKHSDALKRRYATVNHHMLGKTIPEDVKRKMSASGKGKNAGAKNGMFGKPSPMRGRHHKEESILKNRLAHLGVKQCEKTRKKISESVRALWAQRS